MDTSVLEYTAEDLIAHKLARSGLLVAKPRFDKEGADLLAMLRVGDGARFCRIQCKGRTLRAGSRTEIAVPTTYVTSGLVLFLFVETGDAEITHLYCFFAAEMQARWKPRGSDLVLSLKSESFASELLPFEANPERLARVAEVVPTTSVAEEMPLVASIGIATERDEAMPIGSGTGLRVGTAAEVNEALPIGQAPELRGGAN